MIIGQESIKFYIKFLLAAWIIPASIVLIELRYISGISLTMPIISKAVGVFLLSALVCLVFLILIKNSHWPNSPRK
jgi:hypothetical protein